MLESRQHFKSSKLIKIKRDKSSQPTCIFVALQGVKGLWSVQSEDTNVIIVPSCGDESTGVRVVGRNDAHTRYKVGVAGHTVHLREAFIWAGEAEETTKNTCF